MRLIVSIGVIARRWNGFAPCGFTGRWPMDEQAFPDDFKEFLKLLNDADVSYLLIGGFAVGYHN